MGRTAWSVRHTTEECTVVDIFELHKAGFFKDKLGEYYHFSRYGRGDAGSQAILTRDQSGEPIIGLKFTVRNLISGECEPVRQTVKITTTECYFGGERIWFVCPECHNRAAKLHLPPQATQFRCRGCHNLTYRSQREHSKRFDYLMQNPDAISSSRVTPDMLLRAAVAMHKLNMAKGHP